MQHWFLCTAIFLLTIVTLGVPGEATLVSYYSFDGGDPSGISGYCDNPVPACPPANGGTVRAGYGRFGSGALEINSNSEYARIYGLNLFPGSSSSSFSVAAWIRLISGSAKSRVIVQKNSFLSFQLNSLTSSTSQNLALYCRMDFSFQVSTIANTSSRVFTAANSPYWSHVACVYNSSHLCVAVNGSLASCSPAAASQISPSANYIDVGANVSSLNGYVDELKFYDHALTSSQLELLFQAVQPNDVPTAAINADGAGGTTVSMKALQTLQVSVNASDARLAYSGASSSPHLTYTWSILSSSCGIGDITNTSADQPTITLGAVGSFFLNLCATDGELSTSATAQVQVTASQPTISAQTIGPVLVPLGSSEVEVSVSASGVPAPTYQWQVRSYTNTTDPSDPTSNSTEPTSNVTRRLAFVHEEFGPQVDLHWHEGRALVETWNPIPGANASVYQINGTDENNNQTVRCVVSSTGGTVYSDSITILITSPSPTPNTGGGGGGGSGGGSDTNVGAIVGGVVGGSLALLCLFLLLFAALAVLLVARRRNGRRMRKLVQPDYTALAYGDVEGTNAGAAAVVLPPKRKLEHYERLERLLLAEDGRLTKAILADLSLSEADRVCRAAMRVFEAHGQGYALLEHRISNEVAEADAEGTLFRANSVAAKLFGTYVRMTALPYIWFTLVASVNALNDNALEAFGESDSADAGGSSDGKTSVRLRYQIEHGDEEDEDGSVNLRVFGTATSTMEIDPHKVDEASDTTINSLELWLVAQKLFKCIVDSERHMPAPIRQLMRHIDDEVGGRFSPQARFRALGGFLFLRMLCPALMAPQVYGLLDAPPHPVAQRQFILVSKVMQNLANDTLPGDKEAYMEQLNAFIATNKAGLERFYQKLLTGADRGKAVTTEVPVKAQQASLVVLHRYLVAHLSDVEGCLGEDGGSGQLVSELKDVLAQLGDNV